MLVPEEVGGGGESKDRRKNVLLEYSDDVTMTLFQAFHQSFEKFLLFSAVQSLFIVLPW